jgi:hypothetical protein
MMHKATPEQIKEISRLQQELGKQIDAGEPTDPKKRERLEQLVEETGYGEQGYDDID